MGINEDDGIEPPGIRGRLGELCYRSGLLHVLQRGRALARRDLRILAYHRVLTVEDPSQFDFDLDLISASAQAFREQMQLLKRHFHPIGLGEVAAALESGRRLPAQSVVVTFDDGYDDNYRVAYPILRELGIPATFFVSTGHIDSGRPYAYDWLVHMILVTAAEQLVLPELDINEPLPAERRARRATAHRVLSAIKRIDAAGQSAMIRRLEDEWQISQNNAHPDCQPMTWDQLREMRASGFEIGSHGVNHHMLAKLPGPQMVDELVQSRASIERELGTSARLLSYPVGGDRAFNDVVIHATEQAGYLAACSYICGTNRDSDALRYALRRLPVERYMGTGWFAAMLTLPELMGYPTASRQIVAEPDATCSS